MTELASAIPVDMMPGQTDPANQSLPQQAMHACLLPGACQFSTLNRQALHCAVPQWQT